MYLAGSIATVALGRVAYGGSIVALETRYLADAAIPLVLTIGACLLPLKGEAEPWTPLGVRLRASLPRISTMAAAVMACAEVDALSFNSMNGYAKIVSNNPSRAFVQVTKTSLKTLPAEAQIVDTVLPAEFIGPLFANYNLVSRYLSPLVSRERDAETRARTSYTNPYVMNSAGALVPMKIQASAASSDFLDCWIVHEGRVTVPLSNGLFLWGWALRIGYLSDRDFEGTVRLGTGSSSAAFRQGLGEIYVRMTGSGDQVLVTDVPPGVKFCVGDIQVGTPVPAG